MKRLRMAGQSQVVVEEAPEPDPGPGEVLVRTVVSAICGSEMHSYRGAGVHAGNSGHEAAGIVVRRGEGVESPQVGQRVGVSAIAGCGQCAECRAGRYTWCSSFRFYGNMHAEAFVVAALACHPLPDDVPWDVGVLITGDGLGVPYHTSTRLRDKEIQDIAIFGVGPVGLGSVLLQTYLGRRVIAIDRSPDRLTLARTLGAQHTLHAGEGIELTWEIQALTGGRGADVCIEAAGSPETARLCFASVRKGGRVVFNGEQPSLELSPSEDFIRRDITALGSWFYHFHEYAAMLDLYRNGLPIASLVTHRFPLDEASAAYQAMQGKSGKVLLEYGASRK